MAHGGVRTTGHVWIYCPPQPVPVFFPRNDESDENRRARRRFGVGGWLALLGGAAAPLHKSYIRCSNFVRIAAISSLSLRRHFLSRARTSSVVGSSPDSMR